MGREVEHANKETQNLYTDRMKIQALADNLNM